jgi:translocator protein
MKPIFKLIISIAIPLAVGALSGYFTSESVSGWYSTINKPSFNPPNWIFAPVWTVLYILMGIACYIVWKRSADLHSKRGALIVYGIQLALNFAWSILFFYFQQPGWALAEIILLWIFIFITILQFGKISSVAAWLLVPYIAWVSFAALLNFNIWELN